MCQKVRSLLDCLARYVISGPRGSFRRQNHGEQSRVASERLTPDVEDTGKESRFFGCKWTDCCVVYVALWNVTSQPNEHASYLEDMQLSGGRSCLDFSWVPASQKNDVSTDRCQLMVDIGPRNIARPISCLPIAKIHDLAALRISRSVVYDYHP